MSILPLVRVLEEVGIYLDVHKDKPVQPSANLNDKIL